MKKYVFTLLLAGMMVVMTACGNNMNDATGGNQNDTVNDSTTNDNGTTNDDIMGTVSSEILEKTSVIAWKISVKD